MVLRHSQVNNKDTMRMINKKFHGAKLVIIFSNSYSIISFNKI